MIEMICLALPAGRYAGGWQGGLRDLTDIIHP